MWYICTSIIIVLFVIMMIAVSSQTYDVVITQANSIIYQEKCEVNNENAVLVYEFSKWTKCKDSAVLTLTSPVELATKETTSTQKQMSHLSEKLGVKFDNLATQVDSVRNDIEVLKKDSGISEQLKNKLDYMRTKMSDVLTTELTRTVAEIKNEINKQV